VRLDVVARSRELEEARIFLSLPVTRSVVGFLEHAVGQPLLALARVETGLGRPGVIGGRAGPTCRPRPTGPRAARRRTPPGTGRRPPPAPNRPGSRMIPANGDHRLHRVGRAQRPGQGGRHPEPQHREGVGHAFAHAGRRRGVSLVQLGGQRGQGRLGGQRRIGVIRAAHLRTDRATQLLRQVVLHISDLKKQQAVQAATQAGTQAAQAATQAGAQATQAATQAGQAATTAATQAGMAAAVVSGIVGLVVGMFLGMAISKSGR